MNGACNSIINFDPAPWGPGKWSKGQRSFDFNYKVNLKDFLYQTLCLFSQMKDTNSVAWVMPQGSNFGALGVPRGQTIFFQTLSCGISNRRG